MRLSAARELKAQLLRDLAIPEAHYLRRAAPPAAIAVGLTAHGVALRLQDDQQHRDPLVSRYLERYASDIQIEVTGPILAQSGPAPAEPLAVGNSVSALGGPSGTLGGFVVFTDGAIGILSNTHVLAPRDDAAPGNLITSPGGTDGGLEKDRVGTLRSFERFESGGSLLDVASAVLDDATAGLRNAVPEGELQGTVEAEELVSEAVAKVGRTTGHTLGTLQVIELDGVAVGGYGDLGDQVHTFDGVLEISGTPAAPFSAAGDSGSVIYDPNTIRAVALLFAGTRPGRGLSRTYAVPIEAALSATESRLL